MPNRNIRRAQDHFAKSLQLLIATANITQRINGRSTGILNDTKIGDSICPNSNDGVKIEEDLGGYEPIDVEISDDNVKTPGNTDEKMITNNTLRNRNVQRHRLNAGDSVQDGNNGKSYNTNDRIQDKKVEDDTCTCS